MQGSVVLLHRLPETRLETGTFRQLFIWAQETRYVLLLILPLPVKITPLMNFDVGKTSARDIHFIGCLVFNYRRKNEQRIVGEALALDPLRAHRVQVHVDLRPAVITHTIRLVEETSNEEGAWTMELYAGWLDSGTYRSILCKATEMPEVHEDAA